MGGPRSTSVATTQRCADAIPKGVARDAEVQRRLSMLWLELGEVERAATGFTEALKAAHGARFGMFQWAADTLSRQAAQAPEAIRAEQFEEQNRRLKQAQDLQPDYLGLFSVRAHNMLRQARWREALAILVEARTRAFRARAKDKTVVVARFAVDALLLEIALDADHRELEDALLAVRRDSDAARANRAPSP